MIKQKYKPTLLNIASIALIVFDNYTYWTSNLSDEVNNWGLVALILSFIIGVLGLFIDFLLQRFLKNYWAINGIELILLIGFTTIYLWNTRTKTVILPNNFKGYLTIVYGVEKTKPLYSSNLNFGYNIEIPQTGVLFTKTLLKDDVWNTKFESKSGLEIGINNATSKNNVIEYKVGTYNCKGKDWQYRTWLINYDSSLLKTITIDSIIIQKIENYCNKK